MKELLVFGQKTFKIRVPDDARVTFGPWSPPSSDKSARYSGSESALKGTLRVYESSKSSASILAVFSGVGGYRDTSIDYEEKTSIETGSIVWKSDRKGYFKEENIERGAEWDNDPDLLTSGEEKEEED